jgi:uncharacterized membrane protein
MKFSIKNVTLFHALPWILIVGSVVGLFASFVLTADHIKLIENPRSTVSCDLNPIVSCGTVIKSSASEVLGLPNPVFGIAAFSALLIFGVLLAAKITFPRWIWWGLQAGMTVGVLAVHILFIDSIYIINAICPYCTVVWIAVITMFWYTTLYNIRHGYITLHRHLIRPGEFARRHHLDILIFWLLSITVLVISHFWYYFGRNF